MASLANPIGAGLNPERVDQGVDYGGSGPLYALGAGEIVNLFNSGWPGGTFLVLKLNQAVNGQQYVYYAEDVSPLVKVGQKVTAGEHIANANGGSSGIEVGWANSNLEQAAAASEFNGSNSTTLGADFSNLIKSLGGKPGILQNAVSGTTTVQGIQGFVPGVSAAGSTASGAVSGSSSSSGTQGQTSSPSGSSASDLSPAAVLKGAEGLLHGVATVLDYFFGMFGRGQGWRIAFTVIMAAAVWASYRNLTAQGTGGWV